MQQVRVRIVLGVLAMVGAICLIELSTAKLAFAGECMNPVQLCGSNTDCTNYWPGTCPYCVQGPDGNGSSCFDN